MIWRFITLLILNIISVVFLFNPPTFCNTHHLSFVITYIIICVLVFIITIKSTKSDIAYVLKQLLSFQKSKGANLLASITILMFINWLSENISSKKWEDVFLILGTSIIYSCIFMVLYRFTYTENSKLERRKYLFVALSSKDTKPESNIDKTYEECLEKLDEIEFGDIGKELEKGESNIFPLLRSVYFHMEGKEGKLETVYLIISQKSEKHLKDVNKFIDIFKAKSQKEIELVSIMINDFNDFEEIVSGINNKKRKHLDCDCSFMVTSGTAAITMAMTALGLHDQNQLELIHQTNKQHIFVNKSKVQKLLNIDS